MENVTVFENLPVSQELVANEPMELGSKGEEMPQTSEPTITAQAVVAENQAPGEQAGEETRETDKEMDSLYPIFWALQESFSMPTRLFDAKHFHVFKEGLESTLGKFQSVHQDLLARGPPKNLDENRRVAKRKLNGVEDEILNSFNPRYLTSRDLFDLEVCSPMEYIVLESYLS